MERAGIPVVTKEELHRYWLLNYEVLESETERRQRETLLQEAMLLGNGEKAKVKLILETTSGPIMVETTVWDVNALTIELKAGQDVPVCCIREVIL